MNYTTSTDICIDGEKIISNDVVETLRQNILWLSSYWEFANIDANENSMVKETRIIV